MKEDAAGLLESAAADPAVTAKYTPVENGIPASKDAFAAEDPGMGKIKGVGRAPEVTTRAVEAFHSFT